MAIKISGTTAINNSIDIVNARHGHYTGIVTASAFVTDGVNLVSQSQMFFLSARR